MILSTSPPAYFRLLLVKNPNRCPGPELRDVELSRHSLCHDQESHCNSIRPKTKTQILVRLAPGTQCQTSDTSRTKIPLGDATPKIWCIPPQYHVTKSTSTGKNIPIGCSCFILVRRGMHYQTTNPCPEVGDLSHLPNRIFFVGF